MIGTILIIVVNEPTDRAEEAVLTGVNGVMFSQSYPLHIDDDGVFNAASATDALLACSTCLANEYARDKGDFNTTKDLLENAAERL